MTPSKKRRTAQRSSTSPKRSKRSRSTSNASPSINDCSSSHQNVAERLPVQPPPKLNLPSPDLSPLHPHHHLPSISRLSCTSKASSRLPSSRTPHPSTPSQSSDPPHSTRPLEDPNAQGNEQATCTSPKPPEASNAQEDEQVTRTPTAPNLDNLSPNALKKRLRALQGEFKKLEEKTQTLEEKTQTLEEKNQTLENENRSLKTRANYSRSPHSSSSTLVLKDMNWHHALRSQYFHSSAGGTISSLDMFTWLLSVYVFKSSTTRQVYDKKELKRLGELFGALPYYPYTSVVNASGTGKTRLILEALETLPGVYGNLNTSHSGYPKPNNALRNFFFPASTEKFEMKTTFYERRCTFLLLATACVYYLVFTTDQDRKTMVKLSENPTSPRNKGSNDDIQHTTYQYIGMRKVDVEDEGKADLFWESVVKLSEKLIGREGLDDACTSRGTEEGGSSSFIVTMERHGSYLQALRKKLQQWRPHMSSPKGGGVSNPFETTNETPQRTSATSDEIVGLICSYLRELKRISEVDTYGLQGFGSLVQYLQSGTQAPSKGDSAMKAPSEGDSMKKAPFALAALFIAFDESRSLATISAKQKADNEPHASYFRCIRRAAHELHRISGVRVFLIFSDTTSKIANFTPVTALDDSDRTFSHDRVNGTILPPFTALWTESLSMKIQSNADDGTSGDLCRRMVTFCKKWGFPPKDRNVSEIASGFHFSQEWLNARDHYTHNLNGSSEECDVSIITCNEDYFGVGRPLWASALLHAVRPFEWEAGINFARRKLLGGKDTLDPDIEGHKQIRAQQLLAAVACRISLQIDPKSHMSSHLVASHMAYCHSISHDRRSVSLTYPNEPVLATAASLVWREALVGILNVVHEYCLAYVSNQGDVGEICTCILLLMAIDRAYEGMILKTPSTLKTSMYEHVQLDSFLTAMFDVKLTTAWNTSEAKDVRLGSGMRGANGLYIPELLRSAKVRFKSIKFGGAFLNCRDIPLLYEANVGLWTSRYYGRVDIVIPLKLENNWSYLVVQVKMTSRNAHGCEWGGSNLDITQNRHFCVLGNEKKCEVCKFTSQNFLGMVINVWDGIIYQVEQALGKLWTFVEASDLPVSHRPRSRTRRNKEVSEARNNDKSVAKPKRSTIIVRSIDCCKLEQPVRNVFNVLIGDTSHGVEMSRMIKDLTSIDEKFIEKSSEEDANVLRSAEKATKRLISAMASKGVLEQSDDG